jgi:hypothetical protein
VVLSDKVKAELVSCMKQLCMVWVGELNSLSRKAGKVNRYRGVENNIYCGKTERAATLRDQVYRKPDYRVRTARHKDGKNPIPGSVKEQENQRCNDDKPAVTAVQSGAKRQRTCKEMPKVAKYISGADEAVVAQISERVGVTTLQAKGFTW